MFAWRPIAWVGLISYGIYLWHWPLILWLTPVATGLDGLPLAALRVGLTVGVAAASFYLIERPIRRGSVGGFALTPRRITVIVPVAMAVMALVTVGATVRAAPTTSDLDTTAAPTDLTGSAEAGAPIVAIAGDSIPKELLPHLEDEAAARGWSVVPMAYGGCSLTGRYQVDAEGRPFNWSNRCSEGFADLQTRVLEHYEPDLVLWYSNRERYGVEVDGRVLEPNTPEHRAQLDRDLEATFARFTTGGADVAIVLPVPKSPPVIGSCAAGTSASPECAMDEAYYASFADLTDAYRELAQRHPEQVTLVSVDDLLCPAGRDCPLIERDGVAVRPDGIHFSPEGAAWFVPRLFDRAGIDAVESAP